MFKNVSLAIKRFSTAVFFAGVGLLLILLYDNFFGYGSRGYEFNFFAFIGYAIVGMLAVSGAAIIISLIGELVENSVLKRKALEEIAENTRYIKNLSDDAE